MIAYVIKAEGYGRSDVACDFAGQYLAWYDPDLPDARQAMARFTTDPAQAKRFPDAAAALEEWRRVRTVDPVRADGQPNRPLTALTVSIVRAP